MQGLYIVGYPHIKKTGKNCAVKIFSLKTLVNNQSFNRNIAL